MPRVHVYTPQLIFKWPLSKRPLTQYFVVHHIGRIPAGLGADNIDADRVNDWHIERGWAGIGYHFLIRPNGVIEQGRPDYAMGAHDEGENARSIGICVVGDFEQTLPTPKQIIALTLLLADLHEKYGLKPSNDTMCGHRDNEPPETPTECPGKYLYESLPDVIHAVACMLGDHE